MVSDEIDNGRTDTSRPFVTGKTQAGATPEGFLPQITFEGELDLHLDCRALCLKYADILSDPVFPFPATLIPLEIKVDKAKWETPHTSGTVRSQSSRLRRS